MQTRTKLLKDIDLCIRNFIWDSGIYALKMFPRQSWYGARVKTHKSGLILTSLNVVKVKWL